MASLNGPLADVASRISLPHARHWIGGAWVDSETHADSFGRATGNRIGTYAEAGLAEIDRAIAVAHTFRESPWRGDRRLRAKALNEMADMFEAAMDTLIEVLL